MDTILDDVYPNHQAFEEHFKFIKSTHIPETRAPWMI